jgi:hypothetical protein
MTSTTNTPQRDKGPAFDWLDIVIYLARYVETELGGKVTLSSNPLIDDDGVTLRWEKHNLTTNESFRFSYRISYDDLTSMKDPEAYAKIIVENYHKAGKKSVNALETLNTPQLLPQQNDEPIVWDLVIQDMRERDKLGMQKYHTHLQPFNGRDALVDAYQEALDLVVYLRQLIYEKRKEIDNGGR